MKLKALFKLLRPQQWIKNLLLLFPPFFGGALLGPAVLDNIFPALFSFCAASSCSYIINDIKDVEADRNHKSKKKRAIASGDVSVASAYFLALIMLALALLISFSVSGRFWLYIIIYLLISFSYTLVLKNIAIVDIFAISSGFLIRVLAGGEAFDIAVSNWLFMSVFMVSLFLASGKRMGELVSLGDKASTHRKSLATYDPSFLEGILWFSASAAIVTYSLYTIEQEGNLFYTVPLTAFGLLRYIFIVREGRGDPTEALLKDRQIMGVGIIWATAIGIVVYG